MYNNIMKLRIDGLKEIREEKGLLQNILLKYKNGASAIFKV